MIIFLLFLILILFLWSYFKISSTILLSIIFHRMWLSLLFYIYFLDIKLVLFNIHIKSNMSLNLRWLCILKIKLIYIWSILFYTLLIGLLLLNMLLLLLWYYLINIYHLYLFILCLLLILNLSYIRYTIQIILVLY
jgi:hypothetical protein